MNLLSLDYLRCHYLTNQKCLPFMHTKVSTKQHISLLELCYSYVAKARICYNITWKEISHPGLGVRQGFSNLIDSVIFSFTWFLHFCLVSHQPFPSFQRMHLHFQFVHFPFWFCSSLVYWRGIDMRIRGKSGEHTQSRNRMVWGEVVSLDVIMTSGYLGITSMCVN